MAKYSKGAQKKVEKAMHERKRGTLKSGRSGKKVTSRKQAIAIGLSEAREAGAKVPKKGAEKAPKKAAKKAPAKKKSARKPNAAFMAPLSASPALAEVVGSKPLPRTEIIKKIWEYIRKNKLQDSKNRRMINADAKLKVLFAGKSQISMFDLAKVVSKNVK